MLSQINKYWGWRNIEAIEVVSINEFGNIIFKSNDDNYWQICPEELSCDMIATTQSELENLLLDSDFKLDWEMDKFVREAKAVIGELELNEMYCLKLPAVIGAEYESGNLGKIKLKELIAFSGDLAFQIKDLKDGDKFKLKIE